MVEATPNAYNAKKDWHGKGGEKEFVSANTLFIPMNQPVEDDDEQDVKAPISAEEVTYRKRYGDLKKHYDSTVPLLRQEIDQLKAKARTEESYKPPKTASELEEFKKTNPEMYAVVESMSYAQTEELKKTVEEMTAREQKLLAREAASYIRSKHSDFEEIKVDPEFHEWAEVQPDHIKKWIYENPYDGVLAAKAISLYKAETGKTTATKEEKEPVRHIDDDAASLVPTRQVGANTPAEKKVWSEREIRAMSIQEYDAHEAEIDLAAKEGRIRP
jgi:hypothetical protein